MGICCSETVCIPAYDHEQGYGIVIISSALNTAFSGSEIQFHRSMFHSDIRGNSGIGFCCGRTCKQVKRFRYADSKAITYHTGKLTIPQEYRHIVMNYQDICKVTKGRLFILPTVTVKMRNGNEYKFAIFFSRKRFINTLVSMGIDG